MSVKEIYKVAPMFNRILVKRAEVLQKTKGGIVIPEKAQERPIHGTVVAVGPGNRDELGKPVPLQVRVGDKVLLPQYGGVKVPLEENKDYFLFRETDVIAKLES